MIDNTRPYVEKVRQWGGKAAEWNKLDVISNVEDMLGRGYYIKTDSGMIGMKKSHGYRTPWIHVKQACSKRCGIDHTIKFEKFGYIPPRCMQCWKVVVMPRTIVELVKLEELERIMNRPSKCGIEVRNYTPRHYGGYFYNDSLEEGRECYTAVREAVSDMISPDVNVILKRACTEFEMKFGNSGFWGVTPEVQELDDIIETRFENPAILSSKQPDYVKAWVRKEWQKYAFANGDETYLEINGGVPMFEDYQKYHEGDINEIKEEMAIAQAYATKGINPEKTTEFRHLALDYAKANGMEPKDLSLMLGMYDRNYFEPFMIKGADQTT